MANQGRSTKDATALQDLHKHILDNLYDAVYFTDAEHRITYWNQAAEALTGYSSAEVVGKRCSDNVLVHVDEDGKPMCSTGCPLARSAANLGTCQMNLYLRHKDGHRVPVSVRATPVLDDEHNVVGIAEIFNDNSRQKAELEKMRDLSQMAFIDPLTEVANRRYLERKLADLLDQHRKHGTPFALLMVDLDHFKQINDVYGHNAGDAVLLTVARSLSGCLRVSDIVGRWGGDEFVALLPGMTESRLPKKAETCRAVIAHSAVPVGDARVPVTVSIGGAVAVPGDTPDSLLERADRAMYEGKQAGRNRVGLRLLAQKSAGCGQGS